VGFERREKAATARIETVFSINPFNAIKPRSGTLRVPITAGYLREQRDISFQDGPILDSKPLPSQRSVKRVR
jgi:hypothetical protein